MSNGLILDCAIIGITLILGLGGLASGFIKEGFGLAGILTGVYVSTSNSEKVGRFINDNIYKSDNEVLLNLFGFVLTLVVVWGVFIILGKIVSRFASLSGLGIFDKIFGFIFGAGKMFLVISVIASCINAVPILNNRVSGFFANSFMYPVLVDIGRAIANIQAVQDTIKTQSITTVKKELQ